MSHLPHLSELVAAAAALLRRTPPADLPYPADGPIPEPAPADWQAIEPRWDCQQCRSVQPAEIHTDWFRCLKCGIETPTVYA